MNYATRGVDNDKKLRWQFSVLLRHTPASVGEPYLNRTVRVFGPRALVGHTGQQCYERRKAQLPNGERRLVFFTSRIAHNAKSEHVESVALRGLHAQMSTFHRFDKGRVQESSRVAHSDTTVIADNVEG